MLADQIDATLQYTPSLAATSAEFHLFPQRDHDNETASRFTQPVDILLSELVDTGYHDMSHLSQLRTNAFWELHRSVEENGEGLVRRMRDYEHSRSRSDVYLKAKEAQKRDRKRSSLATPSRKQAVAPHDSDGDDDDDIQIFSREPSQMSASPHRQKTRALSLGFMDNDVNQDHHSSPGATCDSSSSTDHSDEDVYLVTDIPPLRINHSFFSLRPASAAITPALSRTPSDSTNSSLISLPRLPTSPSSPSTPPPQPFLSAKSRSEKAIAALSLSMANGAGGLTDYQPLLSLQTTPLEPCQVGEMWY
jgi:hypothetical protein